MARIRTIKPEFWTDEKIVALPFAARLLFIGLWNFCDDTGAIDDSPDRLRMQIFPGDPEVDVSALLDLLTVVGLIERWRHEGEGFYTVSNWAKHQKIDNPSRKTMSREGYRKLSIPGDVRVAVATKYGCKPGGEKKAECYYCGAKGSIHWWNGARGKPTKWITLGDLEFDHFDSEHAGGDNTARNIVLACRPCNRGKREFDAAQFFAIKNPTVVLARASEGSALDRDLDLDLDQGSTEGRAGARLRLPDSDRKQAERPEGVDPEIWRAFIANRTAKRKPLTPRAWLLLSNRINSAGVSPNDALTRAVEKGWADWDPSWGSSTAAGTVAPRLVAMSTQHIPNMPLGTPTCQCQGCVDYRAKRKEAK